MDLIERFVWPFVVESSKKASELGLLLKQIGAGATWLRSMIDTIKADPRIMLTYSWDGVPLSGGSTASLRIHTPDMHGMKRPKWIESIEETR